MARRSTLVVGLAVATVFALLWALPLNRAMALRGDPVVTDAAPWGVVSLQLAASRRAVVDVRRSWERAVSDDDGGHPPTTTRLAVARELLDLDVWFVPRYTTFLALLGLTLIAGIARNQRHGAKLALPWAVAVVAIGTADGIENQTMRVLLHAGLDEIDVGVHDTAIRVMRLSAQAKFLLLLGAGVFLLNAAIVAFRSYWDPESLPTQDPPAIPESAEEAMRLLVAKERPNLGLTPPDEPQVATGPAGEPWIRFRSADVLGLALSGGGIRSATFGLGVLQGLDHLRILQHVHYLSTVSGGGYIGGFWSAWRQRARRTTIFPTSDVTEDGPATGDSAEVRHLREFSRFLSPRVGFFETEMWHAIIAFVGGLLPSLAATLALLFLGLVGWLAINYALACPDPWFGALTLTASTAVICLLLECRYWWPQAAPQEREGSLRINVRATLVAAALMGLLQAYLPTLVHRVTGRWHPLLDNRWQWVEASGATWPAVGTTHVAWWHGLLGIPGAADTLYVSPRVFDFPIVWLVAGLVGLVVRLIAAMVVLGRNDKGTFLTAFDRLLMRVVGLAVLWIGAGVLWHAGMNLDREQAWTAAGGAIATGGTFAMLRRWMSTALRETPANTVLARARPYLPQLLAYLTIALVIAVLVKLTAAGLGHDWMRWYLATAAAATIVVLTLHLDPAEFSLHAFYRDRICRAYIGASNPAAGGSAADNRATEYQYGDDVLLEKLAETRPLHLICCAANDLSGDQVATLSRGAKSATLSQHGVAIGGYLADAPRMTLGSALTASAAAFNSTMGGLSKRLGPAVTFLMAAMNLRLGVWVPHPAVRTARRRLFPGSLFYKELFGLTDATPRSKDDTRTDVHLSDGGHFENLAFYELVRRHCRYVIVVDAGQDLDVAFDDFGNAARRVREDFGVEIEIDLSPLSAGTGPHARQHVAVGTIHYDRRYDKGILVYLKPTLTGDEPPDVCQYQRRNNAFPHEPTTDQFYDEAQWESYRRLGVHTALSAFRFVEGLATRQRGVTIAADRIFTGVRQEWWPTPSDMGARILAATERLASLEGTLLERKVESLLAEVFPEMPIAPRVTPPTDDDLLRLAATLVEVTQVLEDIWLSCDLETQWNHPLNLGWINTFARWANAPTFRAWWPVITPMFSPKFQQFMRERFAGLGGRAGGDIVVPPGPDLPGGLATAGWLSTQPRGTVPGPRVVFTYVQKLEWPDRSNAVQTGLVLLDFKAAEKRVQWTSEDFFVPPSLWGAGIGGAFLDDLLAHLAGRGIETCDVFIVNRHYQISRNLRAERVGFLEFYRGRGFQMVAKGAAASAELTRLLTQAGGSGDVDAWVQLRWTAPPSSPAPPGGPAPPGAPPTPVAPPPAAPSPGVVPPAGLATPNLPADPPSA